jgi:UDP-N-acetylglucosamine:LPS N-acetylglucosamine transferase
VCALPFPDTDLPNGVVTGNPIRPAIVATVADADPAEARRRLLERAAADEPGGPLGNVDDRVLVAVWAGSLGARRINDAVVELAQQWSDRSDLLIYHIVGRRDWDSHGGTRPDNGDGLVYLRVPYEANMPELLAAADLAVCRAGASTVTELAVAGLPSLLVPLPSAPRDHQRANTAELAAAGGALVVDDGQVTADRLAELLEPLLGDADRRAVMAEATRSVARPDAATDVARLLLEVGGLQVEPGARPNGAT